MATKKDDFFMKIIQSFNSVLVTTQSFLCNSYEWIITDFFFEIIAQKCYILIKNEEKVSTIKKGKQLAHDICSFCLIYAYRLKSVLLCISVGLRSSFLFELYVYRLCMKVKVMHNLLKLAPIDACSGTK